MHDIVTILLVLAAVSFACAVVGIPARVNLLALGLLAWVLAALVPRL